MSDFPNRLDFPINRTVDPDGYYLLKVRLLNVWPCDKDGYITGEESYSGTPSLTSISEDDLPENFKAYVARRKQKESVGA
jgi:hypothetical protein